MSYRCQHCDETIKDPESRAGRETCYVSPNGRHRWIEAVPEGYEAPETFPDMERAYGN